MRLTLALLLFIAAWNPVVAQESTQMAMYAKTLSDLYESLTPDEQREPALAPAQWRESAQYKSLVHLSPDVWQEATQQLDTIAPSQAERTILFQSFEGLPPSDYLRFLKSSLDLYQQKRISALEFERVFSPPGRMRFFLAYNYDSPEVRGFLKSVQTLNISESIADNIGDYISGNEKQRIIAFRNAHPELAKPVPLLEGGYAPPDPATSMTPDPMSAPLWLNAQKASGQNVSPPIGLNEQSTPPLNSKQSQASFPIVPVAILALAIIAVIVVLMRRKLP